MCARALHSTARRKLRKLTGHSLAPPADHPAAGARLRAEEPEPKRRGRRVAALHLWRLCRVWQDLGPGDGRWAARHRCCRAGRVWACGDANSAGWHPAARCTQGHPSRCPCRHRGRAGFGAVCQAVPRRGATQPPPQRHARRPHLLRRRAQGVCDEGWMEVQQRQARPGRVQRQQARRAAGTPPACPPTSLSPLPCPRRAAAAWPTPPSWPPCRAWPRRGAARSARWCARWPPARGPAAPRAPRPSRALAWPTDPTSAVRCTRLGGCRVCCTRPTTCTPGAPLPPPPAAHTAAPRLPAAVCRCRYPRRAHDGRQAHHAGLADRPQRAGADARGVRALKETD